MSGMIIEPESFVSIFNLFWVNLYAFGEEDDRRQEGLFDSYAWIALFTSGS
jgi:hypothetical protein